MQQYGLDGVAVQRFVSNLDGKTLQRHFDAVLKNVRFASESHHRGFLIMYDGIQDADRIEAMKRDWQRLTEQEHLTESPAYMFHRGKPVVALWGIGFPERKLSPSQTAELIQFFRAAKVPATVLGGVPAHWRTLDVDSRPDHEWAAVYRSLDVISPWTVGRFGDDASADQFARQVLLPDLMETRRLGIDYMPVAWPGFSWHNGPGRATNSPLNKIPRRCGEYYERQLNNILNGNANMIYTAMFDEANEATSIFKMAAHANDLPNGVSMVPLDADGCLSATGDMYLKLAGDATRRLHENGKKHSLQ
jgi:hypothetical protein